MSGRRSGSGFRRAAEQADLAALLLLRLGLGAAQHRFGTSEQPRAVRLQRVERTGADQILKLHPVELARIDPRREIREIGERPLRRAPPPATASRRSPTFFTAASA